MQKWNYLFIVVDYENGNHVGRPRYVNGQELPNWKQGENIFGVINRLRWKGWEPASFGLGYPAKWGTKQTNQPMLFRRPKA